MPELTSSGVASRLISALRGHFSHRAGRVISLSRVVLSLIFLISSEIVQRPSDSYDGVLDLIAAAYAILALAYLWASWSNWWLETRLVLPAHIMDIGFFGATVYFSEGFNSPFFSFYLFIVLSAAIRWGWRETAISAVALISVFFITGYAALLAGRGEFELSRFIIRSTNLLVIPGLLIWFGVNQQHPWAHERAMPFVDSSEMARPPLLAILRQALAATGGGAAYLLWWHKEEPWRALASLEQGEMLEERYGPESFGNIVDESLTGQVFLFDPQRRRALMRNAKGRIVRKAGFAALTPALTGRLDEAGGLSIPLHSGLFEGQLFIVDIPGLSADHIQIGETLRDEFSADLEHTTQVFFLQDAAAVKARLVIARDLHDSVMQLLTGVAFKVTGMKRRLEPGDPMAADLDVLKEEISAQQRDLRLLINSARDGFAEPALVDLGVTARQLVDRLAGQWDVRLSIACSPASLECPAPLANDIYQFIRESVANAVRHGGADKIRIEIEQMGSALSMAVEDNGSGMKPAPNGNGETGVNSVPWSLNQRVHRLGGTLQLDSDTQGTQLTFYLPMAAA